MLAAVMPLPSEEVTPPVTKTYFAMGQVLRGFFRCYRIPDADANWWRPRATVRGIGRVEPGATLAVRHASGARYDEVAPTAGRRATSRSLSAIGTCTGCHP